MASVKTAFAGRSTMTWTGTSLANAAAREATAIDNTANLYLDALVRVRTKGSAAGNTGYLEVYAYSGLSDTVYSDGATGVDAAFTAANRKNAVPIGYVYLNGTTAVISQAMSVAAAFGGILPSKWGILIVNSSGAALSATAGDHIIDWEGITQTVA